MIPVICVHGGAGRVEAARHHAILAACTEAAEVGHALLRAGGRALDAVQAAVRVLEDCPELNAGTGAVLNRAGEVELDAAIVDGEALAIGAVAAVPDLRQPIELARAVLDDGVHVLLAGPAAWDFARARGFTPAPPGSMITERSRARWQAALAAERTTADGPRADEEAGGEREGGTVGAVALDRDGHVAAATSTGGINVKRRGRVGDSPLPGAGTWADDRGGAASATGDGEAIIRVALTRRLVDRVAAGEPLADAAAALVGELAPRGRGHGGVIAVDREGRLAAVHDTETMAVAAVVGDGVELRRVATMSTAGTTLERLLDPRP
jgi:beta-aspartyl-peptidase (threonine type)